MAIGGEITGGPRLDEYEDWVDMDMTPTSCTDCIGHAFDNVRYITVDCQEPVEAINEKQSWQQMNRGTMSKKQRRK